MPKKYGRKTKFRRNYAAKKIQSKWRYGFNNRVQRACLKKDPVQYRLFGVQALQLTQTPIVIMNVSNLKARNDITNAMYLRTSRKIMPQSLSLKFRVDPEPYAETQGGNFNQVCFALLRHKRAAEIVDAYINNGAGAGALTSVNNKPFLPLNDTTGFNEDVTNMNTGISADPRPELLLKYFNPKVVDVVKMWSCNVCSKGPDLGNQSGVYKPFWSKDFYHKYKHETWKYPEMRGGVTTTTDFPYNNKCYQIVGWSNSPSGIGSHPTITIASRLTFKDLD